MENRKSKVNWKLLITVAKGEATAEDIFEFNNWLAESPENQSIFDEIKKDFQQDSQDNNDVNSEQITDTATAYEIMMSKAFGKGRAEEAPSRLQPVPEENEISEEEPGGFLIPFRFLKISAAAACLLVIFLLGYWAFTTVSSTQHEAKANIKQSDVLELSVAFGHQARLTLNDGSVVRLSPGSKFKYPKVFDSQERRVFLEGEAFFEVSKDPAKPFIVQTDRLQTQVLGTSFNVEAFKGQNIAKVIVATGKVSVSRNKAGARPELLAYLSPNNQIEFNSTNDSFSLTSISENVVRAIKDGKLVFDGNSMKEVGEALQRRYGVEVTFEDEKMKAMRVTTMLEYMSIDGIADMLSLATNLKVSHINNHLYFKRNK